MLRTLTLAVFLTAATSTQAAIITSGYFNSLEKIQKVPGNTDLEQTVTLNLFDSSLGTLDEVFITYQVAVQQRLIIDNDSPDSSTFD